MQFSIKNVSLFKEKLQKITNFVSEAAVKFRRNNIQIYAMSPDNVVAIELLIPKKNLSGYVYKPTKSIALNLIPLKMILSRFKSIKGNLRMKLIGDKIEMFAMDGEIKKTFCIPTIILDDEPQLPKWKPNVKWKVEGIIDGLSKIWMFVNKGPLIVESINDDFPLRWFIAPMIINKGKRTKR